MASREKALTPVVRTIEGDRTQVRNVMETAYERGTLVAYSKPVPLGLNRVRVELTLLEPVEARTVTRSVARRLRVRLDAGSDRRQLVVKILVGVAALAAVSGAVWLLVQVVELVISAVEWVGAHLPEIIGGIVGLLILVAWLMHIAGGGSGGGGKHCPGCDG